MSIWTAMLIVYGVVWLVGIAALFSERFRNWLK